MDNVRKLADFIRQVVADPRLTSVHLSVSLAFCDLWIINQLDQPFSFSRRVIMKSARIRSKATYHKVIRDLSTLGYICYKPSYHPRKGSTVTITSAD